MKLAVTQCVEWRSKGRGVEVQRYGIVVKVVNPDEIPYIGIEEIVGHVRAGLLPPEAEWSESKFRQSAVPRRTVIVWGFSEESPARTGFYRPSMSRIMLIPISTEEMKRRFWKAVR